MTPKLEEIARAIAAADGEDYMEDFQRYDARARAAVAAMRTLPENIASDPYWDLNHVRGATGANPIPSMRAAIEAYVDEVLR